MYAMRISCVETRKAQRARCGMCYVCKTHGMYAMRSSCVEARVFPLHLLSLCMPSNPSLICHTIHRPLLPVPGSFPLVLLIPFPLTLSVSPSISCPYACLIIRTVYVIPSADHLPARTTIARNGCTTTAPE